MDLGLSGRVVYVTGGSRGVGRAVVEQLLAEGTRVAACARDRAAFADVFQGTSEKQLLVGACDVRDRLAVRADVARAVEHFGRLDAVVASAGAGAVGGVLETAPEDFAEQIVVKIQSLLNVIDAARSHLVESDAPAVVVINGITAHVPDIEMAAVSAARAALATLVYMLACQLASDGVRVNAVNLGAIVTDRQRQRHKVSGSEQDFDQWCAVEVDRRGIPLNRMGRVEEVAPAIALLVSPLSSYITGASLDVSGGLGIRP
jgi:NAD(P)-dependent dehydrogenase (short-subunit alcohol dehydrogenase family)